MITLSDSTVAQTTNAHAIKLRNIALPVEHGGWAFMLEPLLLGLLLAPSVAGLFLALSVVGVFLIYQPLQLALKDHLKGKRYARTPWAERFALGYGALALTGMVGAALTSQTAFWLPVLFALPIAGLQTFLVIRGKGRSATAEISGAIALGASSAAIVIAGGWTPVAALALWLVPAVRAFSSILYIRIRLRRARGENTDRTQAVLASIATIVITGVCLIAGLLPGTAVLAMAILMARAVYNLYLPQKPVRTPIIGIQEIGFGVLTVLLVFLGYRI
jgi:hypothetical protein